MLKKIQRRILSFKHGLLVLFLFSITVSFLLGSWLSAGSQLPLPDHTMLANKEESSWLEQGLLFDDGIYFVGSEIKPGVYRTKSGDASLYGCRWQRLSGFGAEDNNVIVDYYEDGGLPVIVMIAPGDKGFKTEGCGKWYAASIPVADSPTSFGDGAFIVGVDIYPGTYRSSVQWGCYWERLSGLSRDFYSGRLLSKDAELIAKSNNTIVEIAVTDKAFISNGCGNWTRQEL